MFFDSKLQRRRVSFAHDFKLNFNSLHILQINFCSQLESEWRKNETEAGNKFQS